jgi:hypothetical protein
VKIKDFGTAQKISNRINAFEVELARLNDSKRPTAKICFLKGGPMVDVEITGREVMVVLENALREYLETQRDARIKEFEAL